MKEKPPAPYIPLLDLESMVLDPDHPELIGKDLVTYFNYPGIAEDDIVIPAWLGKSATGESVDFGVMTAVDNPDPDLGYQVKISTKIIEKLRNGQVLYSYWRDEDSDGTGDIESYRIGFDIRTPTQAGMLAPVIKESHQHYVDPQLSDEYTVAVLPYNAMHADDVVTLFLNGTRSNGNPIAQKTFELLIEDSQVGNVLAWALRKTNFTPIKNGELVLHYEIKYASGEPSTPSAKRRFAVKAPVDKELPQVIIKNLADDATLIDLGMFPEGLVAVLPIHELAQVGDGVLLYCTSVAGDVAAIILHGIVDQSQIDDKRIELQVPYAWLADNAKSQISLRYQYARATISGSGAPRELSVSKLLVLGLPTVDDMQLDPEGGNFLDPMNLGSAAYIRIPSNPDIPIGAKITAHWQTADGRVAFDTDTPYSTEPLRFEVPLETVAKCLGQELLVDYDVNGQRSEKLALRIGNLTDHPSIDCFGTGIGNPPTVSKANFDYTLLLNKWRFIAIGQGVKIWLEYNNTTVSIVDGSVWNEDVQNGKFATLLLSHVAGISIGATFTIWASVSFDGTEYMTFKRPRVLKLVA